MNNSIPVYDICTISEFRNEDFLVSRFGSYSRSHQHLHLPHKHNFYHVVLFTKGRGTHTIDFEKFLVKPFQIYFMIPGQVHSWDFDGETDGYIINFSTQFFQSFLLKPDYLEYFPFFSGFVQDAVLDIPDGLQSEIVELFEKIIHETSVSRRMSEDYIKLLLLQIFVLVARLNRGTQHNVNGNYNYTLLKNFKKLIEQNYTRLKLPKEYAGLLYITPNHLNALCKDMLGVPAGEVIRSRILLEAKRLLTNLDMSVSEIAYQLNFTDNSYFTKFFKKQEGLTPDEFRKKSLYKI